MKRTHHRPAGEPDPLRPLMAAWQPFIATRDELADHVLAELGHASRPSAPAPWLRCFRFGAAACLLLLGGVLGMWYSSVAVQRDAADCAAWLLWINPVRAASSTAEAPEAIEALERLDWMRREFALTPGQFRELGILQSRFAPAFEELHQQLEALEQDYRSFELLRRQGQMVDFIALYELLQERDAIRTSAQARSSDFLAAFFSVLQPSQQLAFQRLLVRSAPELADAVPPPRARDA